MFKIPVCSCIVVSLIGLPSTGRAGYGFDTCITPPNYAEQLAAAGLDGSRGEWMRVRGLADPLQDKAKPGETRTVETDREGLRALRARGIKMAVFLRWDPPSWLGGVRPGGGHRLPLDLNEAYERGRRLGAAYGDLVDAWEIENEPDIGFVADNPEVMAAFFKACSLGLKAGARAEVTNADVQSARFPAQPATWFAQKRGRAGLRATGSGFQPHGPPLVIMPPPALPPGPYFQQLWANGIADYTDGFNFHYYGYAQDFSGVYEQFRDCVTKLPGERPGAGLRGTSGGGLAVRGRPADRFAYRGADAALRPPASVRAQRKPLPVFITEYGYGLLDKDARDTVEGRVRQWRWFADVAAQIHTLRPEGPMAFLVVPYYEAELNEFGLTADKPMRFVVGERQEAQGESPQPVAGWMDSRSSEAGSRAAGLTDRDVKSLLQFGPADFGVERAQPWMELIGHKLGVNHATPALAYLWDYAERHPYRPLDWRVAAAPASPVVIDLVAEMGMEQIKSAGGYVVSNHVAVGDCVLSGSAKWVLYNFSEREITGRLEIGGEGVASRVAECGVTLAAGERREIADDLGVQAKVFAGRTLRASFTPDNARVAGAVWATRLFPSTGRMVKKPVAGFEFPAGAAKGHGMLLAKRKTAEGEPVLHEQGRWRVTDGVRVEERDGVWRFHIDHLPAEPLTSAVAELPLPDGFVFGAGMMLSLERRKTKAVPIKLKGDGEAGQAESPGLDIKLKPPTPAQMKSRAGRAGDMMSVIFRTENGNLYQTWPRLRVFEEWANYTEQADNFTMGFFGRAALPWRFFDNRPASLVFVLRPSVLPALFEVRRARIERVERADFKSRE